MKLRAMCKQLTMVCKLTMVIILFHISLSKVISSGLELRLTWSTKITVVFVVVVTNETRTTDAPGDQTKLLSHQAAKETKRRVTG